MLKLPEGLTARPPALGDAPAVLDLYLAHDRHQVGEDDTDLEDILVDWQRSGFDLALDAVLVLEGNRLVGEAEVWRASEATVVVHPERLGRGIGTALLEWVERRGREQLASGANARTLTQHAFGGDPAAISLLERHGYRKGTYTWRMDMEMDEPPPEPAWPPGIGVRTFDPARDAREVHELVQRAFAEGWEHEDVPFEEWQNFMMGRETFDPSLWFLAVDGDRIVGTALSPNYPDIAWIRQVAVRREYRGRGIGRALLLHAMREFHRRGWRRAGLTVEAENRTGARRLYESVGMQTRYEFIHMEKSLR